MKTQNGRIRIQNVDGSEPEKKGGGEVTLRKGNIRYTHALFAVPAFCICSISIASHQQHQPLFWTITDYESRKQHRIFSRSRDLSIGQVRVKANI